MLGTKKGEPDHQPTADDACSGLSMNFDLSVDHLMVQEMVRKFAAQEVAPKAAYYDRTADFPWEIVKKMAELNLLAIITPTEYGGAGLDAISYSIVIEELSKACASTGVIAAVHNTLAQFPIIAYGTPEQKKKYLPRLAQGEIIGAYALSEPSSGSDAASLQTTVRREGDCYILNGSKVFITNAIAADLFIVYATLDKEKGAKGITAFIVEKSFPGFKVGRHEEMMGVRASGTCELIMENCKVPLANRLGEEGDGFKIALATLDCGRISIGAQAVGIASASLEASLKYSQERSQFGQPISHFQLIQEKLVEMAVEIDAARLLVYRASYLKDKGVPFGKEASMAKLFASRIAVKAGIEAVQIFGGYGYTKDYPVERHMRDAKITEIYEGTSEVQKMVIARKLLGLK